MHKSELMKDVEQTSSIDESNFQAQFIDACQNDKYKSIVELTARELIEQLYIRANIYHEMANDFRVDIRYVRGWHEMYLSDSIVIKCSLDDTLIDINEVTKNMTQPEVSLLKSFLGSSNIVELGEVKSALKKMQVYINDLCVEPIQRLPSLRSITPLSVSKIYDMATLAKSKELNPLDSFSAHHRFDANVSILSSPVKCAPGESIAISINLSGYTNKEILEDMSKLLDEWRNKANIETKSPGMKTSRNSLQKTITYKYVLLLDAMIANLFYGGAINDSLILAQVYPRLEIEPESLRKTHKKNALAFASPRCVNAWESTLSCLELWEQPVRKVLDRGF